VSILSDLRTRLVKSAWGIPPETLDAESQAGMDFGSSFSPGTPLAPYAGVGGEARRWGFQTGYNIKARAERDQRVSFDVLAGLIDNYDIARMAIGHRIDDVRSLDWGLVPTRGFSGDAEGAIAAGYAALKHPEGPGSHLSFRSWEAKFLEDVLRYDAGTLFRRRDRAGRVIGLKVVSGRCYSDDTEVLTRSGWKLFTDVDITRDEFATRNQKTKAFEWQVATHKTVDDWVGEEPLYHFNSRHLDLLVTPNHRMLVTSLPHALGGHSHRVGEAFVSAEDLAAHATGKTAIPATSTWNAADLAEFRIPSTGSGYDQTVTMTGVREARHQLGWSQAVAESRAGLSHQTFWSAEAGRSVRITTAQAIHSVLPGVTWESTGSQANFVAIAGDDFAAFMGMWLSEGSLSGARPFVYVTQMPQSKGYEQFRDLLTRIVGREPKRTASGSWRFKSSALSGYLRQFGHAPDKFIPAEILDMSARQLGIFWRFYMLGDGCYDGNRERITTASKQMADGLQEVAQKIGRQAVVTVQRPRSTPQFIEGRQIFSVRPQYMVSLRTTEDYLVRNVDRVPYDGKVYCVTVPNETLYVRRNGKPSWCGNTIAPVLDYWGDTPSPPARAYVQFVNGQPWKGFTSNDLVYSPFRPQPDSAYGFAPLESVLLTANTDIRFQMYFLNYFTSGTVPEGFMTAPEGVSPEQLETYQSYWDALLYGDEAAKHQMKMIPFGTALTFPNAKVFDDKFPTYLMRKVAAAYHVTPNDLGFTDDVNRSTSESQVDVQFRIGTLPLVQYMQDILSAYLQDDLGLPVDLVYDTGQETDDRLSKAQAHKIYIEMGVESPDEVRSDELGLEIDNEMPVPRGFFSPRTGWVPLVNAFAVAGPIDPETLAPRDDVPLLTAPFEGTQGIVADKLPGVPAFKRAPVNPDEPNFPALEGKVAGSELMPVTPPAAPVAAAPALPVVKESGAFSRFVKARLKSGTWRDFQFGDTDSVTAHRLNQDGRAIVRKAAGEVVAAGLCVQAADTGRVLMLQRGLDESDPASGTLEFPGGHVEGDESPQDAAIREWQEETGLTLPAGSITGGWEAANGVYVGFVLTTPVEADVPILDGRDLTSDPDVDGDTVEAIMWIDPNLLVDNPIVRDELAADMVAVLDCLGGSGEGESVAKSGSLQGVAKSGWESHPVRKVEAALATHHAGPIQAAIAGSVTREQLQAVVAAYIAAQPDE